MWIWKHKLMQSGYPLFHWLVDDLCFNDLLIIINLIKFEARYMLVCIKCWKYNDETMTAISFRIRTRSARPRSRAPVKVWETAKQRFHTMLLEIPPTIKPPGSRLEKIFKKIKPPKKDWQKIQKNKKILEILGIFGYFFKGISVFCAKRAKILSIFGIFSRGFPFLGAKRPKFLGDFSLF